jgi:hypothetical protein
MYPPRHPAVRRRVPGVARFALVLALVWAGVGLRVGVALAVNSGGLAAPNGVGTVPSAVGGATPGGGGSAPGAAGRGATAPVAAKKAKPVAHRTPAPRAPAAGSPVPVVTEALCFGACTAGVHAVPIGGNLVLHGHHIGRGMLVLFPTGAVAASVTAGARLRLSRKGFIVTVPAGARSGRITVVSPAGVHSRPFGPIRVIAPRPVVVNALPAAPVPGGSAFQGLGQWIWYVNKSEGGNLDAIAARAHAAGVTTVYVKSSDGSTNFWPQFTPALVAGLHQRGLHVCAWQYVYGTHPAEEAQLGARAAAMADCLVIDAEAEYEGKYSSAQTYIQTLRAAIGPNYPVGLASFPYVDRHKSLPYSVFLGPIGAQFNLPQVYWHEIGVTTDVALAHTYHENRIYARPIMPLGETYGGTPPADIFRFRQLSSAYGATGLSFWDWQETTANGWAALGQPLTPAANAAVDATVPVFAQGGTGDQVVWMQEHLAAAEPQTPTTGIFDATTTAALIAFQASRGLPQSGTTDAATWAALLGLTPVAVDWTASATPG